MEDVIFSGTQKRKQMGFALVTLNIDNSEGTVPEIGKEISVTRRYYRSGDSEYILNGKHVRLKDIHELFMDTGLGRDGYSMIGQGRVSEIVGVKSEERRAIFEEAAGVSKFRYKKEDAERKLVAAEDNLVRIQDIISELSKPGRDPRESLPKPILRSDVLKFDDLQEGMELTGTVRNVIDFGAFVDVGVKHDGLVHISEMADRYIKNPSEVVSVGDIVKVKVLSIDREKQKVSLTMKI